MNNVIKILVSVILLGIIGVCCYFGILQINAYCDNFKNEQKQEEQKNDIDYKALYDDLVVSLNDAESRLTIIESANNQLVLDNTALTNLVASFRSDILKLFNMIDNINNQEYSINDSDLINGETKELLIVINNYINQVNLDLEELNATITSKDTTIEDLNATITSLNSRIAELEEELNVDINELLVNNARLSMELTGIYDIDVNYLGLNESQLLVVADVNDVVADLGCFSAEKLIKFYEIVADSRQAIVLRNSYQASAFAGTITDSNGKVLYDNTKDRYFSKLNYSFANLIVNCSGSISNVTGSFSIYNNYWVETTNSTHSYVDIAVCADVVEEITLSGKIDMSTISIENADGTSKDNVSLSEIKTRIDEFSEVRILNVMSNTANIIVFR